MKTITLNKYIKENINSRDLFIAERNLSCIVHTIRIPYYIVSEEVILDKDKIKKERLRVYENEGKQILSDDVNKTVKFHKYGVVQHLSKYPTPWDNPKYIFNLFKEKIEGDINKGIKEREIYGFGKQDKDEPSIKCGKEIIKIDGFCNLVLPKKETTVVSK